MILVEVILVDTHKPKEIDSIHYGNMAAVGIVAIHAIIRSLSSQLEMLQSFVNGDVALAELTKMGLAVFMNQWFAASQGRDRLVICTTVSAEALNPCGIFVLCSDCPLDFSTRAAQLGFNDGRSGSFDGSKYEYRTGGRSQNED